MTPQERDLTTILLDRLSKTEGQPKDTEAETLIRDTTAERPDAPYSLVQTVLIQDLSLHDAQIKITGLETKLTETKCASSAPPSFLGGPSFLGAVFGRIEPSGGARTSNVPPGGAGTGSPPLATTPQPGHLPEGGFAAPPSPGAGRRQLPALGGDDRGWHSRRCDALRGHPVNVWTSRCCQHYW
jgi:hypothetical protein